MTPGELAEYNLRDIVYDLLDDRDEIKEELRRIQRGRVSGNWSPYDINKALATLIERIR